ncbi:MAG: hypothetical protein H6779_02575 [Candidatus Nomurabacteria bacterium]|nr:hypothetical protein [Candidatus Nomurabacteria bacterium]USN87274.1 MAG: hypothetical protein H6779_02575 [Candidatus Nomurabacteria bacterium]
MKTFFRNIFTIEAPFGEIWLSLAIVVMLFLTQVIDISTTLGLIASGLFLICIYLLGYLIQKLWHRYVK